MKPEVMSLVFGGATVESDAVTETSQRNKRGRERKREFTLPTFLIYLVNR